MFYYYRKNMYYAYLSIFIREELQTLVLNDLPGPAGGPEEKKVRALVQ